MYGTDIAGGAGRGVEENTFSGVGILKAVGQVRDGRRGGGGEGGEILISLLRVGYAG